MSSTAEDSTTPDLVTDTAPIMPCSNGDATKPDTLDHVPNPASTEESITSSSSEIRIIPSSADNKLPPRMKLEPTLCGMPREIRDQIFDVLHDNEIIIWCTSYSVGGVNWNRMIKGKRRHRIMAVNRQLHDEFNERPARAYVRTNRHGLASAISLPPFTPAPIIKKVWLQIGLYEGKFLGIVGDDRPEQYYKSRLWQSSEHLVAWAPELEWLRIEVARHDLFNWNGAHESVLRMVIEELVSLYSNMPQVSLMVGDETFNLRQGKWRRQLSKAEEEAALLMG